MEKMTIDDNTFFALDIGTRSVIGIVIKFTDGNMKVIAQSIVEHQSRAMLDGQIHDIPRVADAVQRVKTDLEKKTKQKLSKAAIAAAGRSLKTCQTKVEQILNEDLDIDPIMINTLELLGIKQAQETLEKETRHSGEKENYLCVGHSVVGYYLNDYPMANLEGHRGKKIGADVLATFLPASVVNSLYAVLARVGLEALYLTLEPIAACEVIIPENLRLLNLALVDVGAGTSDIAISRDGAIVAYGMVPIAGDEITELIVERLMVDFMTAEYIKRSLSKGKDIKYQDVLGIEYTVTCAEILQLIEPAIENLAGEIAQSIKRLNANASPKSVMCVGGGSQIPSLMEKVSHKLELVNQRVVIRNRSNINSLVDTRKKELAGPEGVTVIGIAAVAARKLGQNFINITVNGKPFTLFNTKKLNVLQALGLLDFNPRELLGQNGKDLSFILNGNKKTFFGELAKPAVISVNAKPANLQTVIKDGDVIFVQKAQNGKDAKLRLSDIIKDLGLNEEALTSGDIICKVNDKKINQDCLIASKDTVEVNVIKINSSTELTSPTLVSERQDGKGFPIEVTVNNKPIMMSGKNEYILIDVFNYYELDISKTNGLVEIKINGNDAEYTETLHDGDAIEIHW